MMENWINFTLGDLIGHLIAGGLLMCIGFFVYVLLAVKKDETDNKLLKRFLSFCIILWGLFCVCAYYIIGKVF